MTLSNFKIEDIETTLLILEFKPFYDHSIKLFKIFSQDIKLFYISLMKKIKKLAIL